MLAKTGSVKRGIFATDLLEERAKCAFDQEELRLFLHGGPAKLQPWKNMIHQFGDDPELRNSIEFYDLTPHEMHENLWKRLNVVYKKHKKDFFEENMIRAPYAPDLMSYFQSPLPVAIHLSMFRLCLEYLANDE